MKKILPVLKLDAHADKDADTLIEKVSSKFIPILTRGKYTQEQKRAIYRYLFSRRPKKLPPSMKNRLVNLYDSPADRSARFHDGLRWCLNVYVGCQHQCHYCYVNVYGRENVGLQIHAKANFEKTITKDIREIRELGVPAVPLHLSNSTDPLQEGLETDKRHTLFSLKQIIENRELFTSIVLLTKNPALLCTDPYLDIITNPVFKPFAVQVTCAYWNENARKFFEPHAPTLQSRFSAIEQLVKHGVDVELRIDPLFPSSRINKTVRLHEPLARYSLVEAQTAQDIDSLVAFAKRAGVAGIVAKPLKVPMSKRGQRCKDMFANIYADASPDKKRHARGGSWRLPEEYQKELVATVFQVCTEQGIPFKHCKHDVLSRK